METYAHQKSDYIAIDIIKDGKGVYSGKSFYELKKEYPDLIESDHKDFLEHAYKMLITEPVEINEERYIDMLECLPPCKWNRGEYTESFFMSEAKCYDIHSHFVRIGKRFFEFDDKRSLKHDEKIQKVFNSAAFYSIKSNIKNGLSSKTISIIIRDIKSRDKINNPRVGDWLHYSNGIYRRVADTSYHVQPSYHIDGSLYLTGNGAQYSGSLHSSINPENLKLSDDKKDGIFWVFKDGHAGAGRGVYFSIPCRVYDVLSSEWLADHESWIRLSDGDVFKH